MIYRIGNKHSVAQGATTEVPEAPHLEPEALIEFERHISSAESYLEYGAGGSTVYAAARMAGHIVSVDSSLDWANAVRARVGQTGRVEVLYCDIGAVGAWGRPLDQQGLYSYHRYMSKPWEVARDLGMKPAVVLIDGRFRVACFLYSLVCAQAGTIILFDDYVSREQYHVVEEFISPIRRHGRMAVFEVTKSFDLQNIIAKIAEYSILPD